MNKQEVHVLGIDLVYDELVKRGWQVVLTDKKIEGFDMLINKENSNRKISISVSALTKRKATSIGPKKEAMIADFFVICRNEGTNFDKFKTFIMPKSDARENSNPQVNKKRKIDYWIEIDVYEHQDYAERWDRIV